MSAESEPFEWRLDIAPFEIYDSSVSTGDGNDVASQKNVVPSQSYELKEVVSVQEAIVGC